MLSSTKLAKYRVDLAKAEQHIAVAKAVLTQHRAWADKLTAEGDKDAAKAKLLATTMQEIIATMLQCRELILRKVAAEGAHLRSPSALTGRVSAHRRDRWLARVTCPRTDRG
jgi:hypothetical protein